jgi:hypothetical protein
VSVDSRFERAVLAEFALAERRTRRQERSESARALVERLHRGRHDLLAHLRRVAYAVPMRFWAVAWLHHAGEARAARRTLIAVGLSPDEVGAVELLEQADPPPREHALLSRIRALSNAPGMADYLARVVARAAIEDRLEGARPIGDILAALRLLPDPRLAR